MEKDEKRKKKRIVLLILLMLLLFASCCFAYYYYNHNKTPPPTPDLDEQAVDWEGNQDLPNEKADTTGIAIPCFEKLVFTKDQLSQKINLYNPSENSVYFIISFILDDEVLWKSDMLEPGKGFYEIELNHTLAAGDYTAYLLYQCFSMDDLSELNSGNVAINLIVQ